MNIRKSRRAATSLFVIALGCPLLFNGAAASAPAEPLPTDSSGLKPGDWVHDRGGVSAIVPRRGQTVIVEALLSDDVAQVLEIETFAGGDVAVRHRGREGAYYEAEPSVDSNVSDGGAIPACSDPLYQLRIHRYSPGQTGVYWFLNSESVSNTSLTVSQAQSAINRGGAAMANARNDCGLADNVEAPVPVAGTTPLSANVAIVNGANACVNEDVYSVSDFGSLASPLTGGVTIAVACTFRNTDDSVLASDTRYNKALNWFVGAPPAPPNNCIYRDLEGVAAHEWGHHYGLEHPTNVEAEIPKHLELTMSAVARRTSCRTDWRTLGLGDIRALEAKY